MTENETDPKDEFGELATHVEELAGYVSENTSYLSRLNEKLDTVNKRLADIIGEGRTRS